MSVTSGTTGSTSSQANIIQNDYIIVAVGFEGIAHTVASVTDSASPATSFTQAVSSDVNEDVEVWCGQYTAASGSDTVTVNTRTSASYSFRAIFASGLTSCTPNTTQTNHGTSGSPSVGSFTPVTGDFCEAATSDATGSSSSAWTIAIPFNSQGYYANSGSEVVLQSKLTSGSNWVADSFKGDWDSSYGATTAAFTSSANSLPLWDEAVACFPTYSTGDEMFQGRGFFVRGSSSNPNLAVQAPIHNDYLISIIALPVPSATSHVTSVTDAASDTYTQVVGSGVHQDVEMWIAHYTGTSGTSIGQVTFNLNIAEPAIIGNFEISGITLSGAQSTWASETQTATASGTANSASVASFTPDTRDICIAVSSFSDASSGATWSTPANQPFQQVDSTQQTTSGFTSNYFVTAFRPDWPASTSTTATFTPSVVSSPAWDEIVACFPGSVVVPMTCTMANSAPAATLTLSESSGNGLSPTSVLCDGNPHNVTVDPSVTLTASEPADGATTRYRFSGSTTSVTDTTCAGANSGSCSAWTFTNYEQLENTYTASPRLGSGSTTWDYTGTNDIAISYTAAGSSGTCFLSTTSGGGAVSCSNLWVDYDTQVTFGTLTVSSTEQWVPSADTTSYLITTAGSTRNGDYSRQWQVQFAVSPSSTYGSITPSTTTFYNDTSSVAVTGTANPGYSFAAWTASTSSITFASASSPSTTATIGAAGTITANFVTLSLSESVSDQFAFSGSVVRTLELARVPGDAFTFLESVLPVTLASRAAHDAFSFADAVARNMHLGRGAADAFMFGASASRFVGFQRGVADTFAVSDAARVTTALARALSDAFLLSGGVTRSLSLSAIASDVFSFVDSPLSVSRFSRPAQDTFSIADSVSRASHFGRVASDAFAFLDSPSIFLRFLRAAQDAFSFGDAVARNSHFSRSASDAFSFGDAPSVVLLFSRSAQDVFSFLESAKGNVQLGRSAADSYLFGESATAIGGLIVRVGDSFSFADSVRSNSILQRLASDSFPFLDSAVRNAVFGRSPSDSFPIKDGASRQLSLFRSSADSFQFTGAATAFSGILVLVRDSFLTMDSATRQLSARLSVSDGFIFSETTGGMKHGFHLLHEFVYVSDGFQFIGQATRGLNLPRALSDSITFAESALRAVGLSRGAGDSYLFSVASSRMLSLSAQVGDLVSLVGTGLGRLSHLATTPTKSTSLLFTLPDLLWLLLILILVAVIIVLLVNRRRKEDKFRDWT